MSLVSLSRQECGSPWLGWGVEGTRAYEMEKQLLFVPPPPKLGREQAPEIGGGIEPDHKQSG